MGQKWKTNHRSHLLQILFQQTSYSQIFINSGEGSIESQHSYTGKRIHMMSIFNELPISQKKVRLQISTSQIFDLERIQGLYLSELLIVVMSVINLSFFIEELPAIFRPLPQTFLISNIQIIEKINLDYIQQKLIIILFTQGNHQHIESRTMIQQKNIINDKLLNILKRCQIESDIDTSQLRNMLYIIVESVIQIKQINKQVFSSPSQNKPTLNSKKDVQINGSKMDGEQNDRFFNQKELKLQISNFSNKLQIKLKQLREKIDNQGYQIEKRLYEKWKYLFQQMGNRVDLISPKKYNHKDQGQKLQEQVNNKVRHKNENFKSLRKISLNQQQRGQSGTGRKSLQAYDIKSVMSQEESFLYSNSNYSNRYSIQKELSLQNVQSIMSIQKTIIKNQSQKPIIKPIQINIRVEGIRKSCKIKIETTRMWIAIGVIDINYVEKPIKDIGGRCVYYCNDKQVWDGRKITYNQGIGFVTGDVVEISYDLASKNVEWRVRNKLRHQLKFSSLSFHDNWVPFVYFFNKNDCVSVLPNEK